MLDEMLAPISYDADVDLQLGWKQKVAAAM